MQLAVFSYTILPGIYHNSKSRICSFLFHSRESYNHLSTWLNDARALSTLELVIVLVGNKSDRQEKREVTFLEASRFAQENGISLQLPNPSSANSQFRVYSNQSCSFATLYLSDNIRFSIKIRTLFPYLFLFFYLNT